MPRRSDRTNSQTNNQSSNILIALQEYQVSLESEIERKQSIYQSTNRSNNQSSRRTNNRSSNQSITFAQLDCLIGTIKVLDWPVNHLFDDRVNQAIESTDPSNKQTKQLRSLNRTIIQTNNEYRDIFERYLASTLLAVEQSINQSINRSLSYYFDRDVSIIIEQYLHEGIFHQVVDQLNDESTSQSNNQSKVVRLSSILTLLLDESNNQSTNQLIDQSTKLALGAYVSRYFRDHFHNKWANRSKVIVKQPNYQQLNEESIEQSANQSDDQLMQVNRYDETDLPNIVIACLLFINERWPTMKNVRLPHRLID